MCDHSECFCKKIGLYAPYTGLLPNDEYVLLKQLNSLNLSGLPLVMSDLDENQRRIFNDRVKRTIEGRYVSVRNIDKRASFNEHIHAIVGAVPGIHMLRAMLLFVLNDYNVPNTISACQAFLAVGDHEHFNDVTCQYEFLLQLLPENPHQYAPDTSS